MSQTIVGLDLGSYSIKWVEITRDARTLKVVHAQEARIPLDPKIPREEAQALVLQEQFDLSTLRSKTLITAFPGHLASLRLINIPATDRKNAEKLIPFEIEGQILMDLDDVHLDWEILPMEPGIPEMRVMAATVVRERFRSFMDVIHRMDLDPRDVTLDAVALKLSEYGAEDDACRALVDVGHSKTNVCVVQRGQLLFARSIGIAGREFTRTLEDDFQLPFLEAETLKQADGLVAVRQGPGLSADQERLSKSLSRAVDELAAELRQTLASAEQVPGVSISEIRLMGGSARLKNLAPYLSAAIALPVRRTDYFQALGAAEFSEDQSVSWQPALALALRASKGKPGQRINFRKGDFRPLQSLQSVQAVMGKAMTLSLIVLVCLLLNFIGKSLVLGAKIRKYEGDIQREVGRVVPNYKFKGVQHAVSVVQEKAAGTATDDGPYGKIAAGASPLVSLEKLSSAIPTDIQVTLSDISIDTNTVRVEGTTGSRESVERLREKLAQNPFFAKVSEDKVTKLGETYTFNMTMLIKTNKAEAL